MKIINTLAVCALFYILMLQIFFSHIFNDKGFIWLLFFGALLMILNILDVIFSKIRLENDKMRLKGAARLFLKEEEFEDWYITHNFYLKQRPMDIVELGETKKLIKHIKSLTKPELYDTIFR